MVLFLVPALIFTVSYVFCYMFSRNKETEKKETNSSRNSNSNNNSNNSSSRCPYDNFYIDSGGKLRQKETDTAADDYDEDEDDYVEEDRVGRVSFEDEVEFQEWAEAMDEEDLL